MTSVLNRGAFILSLDTELAWGMVHSGGYIERRRQYQFTRDAINRLLELLEKYNIRATWAIVGHLFLDNCNTQNSIKHPEIIRPTYSWFSGDWFDADPCTSLADAPEWYGKDILGQIINCKVPQEIGCHTFSHMIVGDPGCSKKAFESDIRACCREANEFGLTLKSFVFPRNSVGHLDVLANEGIISYRGGAPSWFGRLPGITSRMGHLLDNFLPVSPPVVSPQNENGLWNLPASYFYPPLESWWKFVPVTLRVHKVKRGLQKAAKQRKLFHLWFHPFNLVTDIERILHGLESIFAEVNQYTKAGLLDNLTMGELAENIQLNISGGGEYCEKK